MNGNMRNHHSKTGLPIPVIVPIGIAVLVAAGLFYVEARRDLQEVPSFGVDGIQPTNTYVDPAAVPAALAPVALPPACATCPSRTNCLRTPGGGVTPVALPPACATCPSRANCLPTPGATPAALPPCATPSPLLQAAYPCVRR